MPRAVSCVFIYHDFEKEDVARTSSYESAIINQVHHAEVVLGHLVKLVVRGIVSINYERLTLTIEDVDLVLLVVVEGLVREVALAPTNGPLADLAHHLPAAAVPHEVAMGESRVMEDGYKHELVSDEATNCIGIWERVDAHGVIVEACYSIQVDLVCLDVNIFPSDPAKGA